MKLSILAPDLLLREKAVRVVCMSLMLGILIGGTACGGGGGSDPAQSGSLSGNWQISLQRHVNPPPPLIFTGFLVQSGNSIDGGLILGSKCSGVGQITGTVNGTNLSLLIDEFGEQISLEGTSSPSLGGEFSNLAGGCTAFPNTGTWTAVQVAPLAGTFHGTFTSSNTQEILNVSGTLTQGPNTGASTASVSGDITVSGPASFCSYLSSATINGLISGTSLALNLYDSNGSQITQIGSVGELNNSTVIASPGVCAPPSGSTSEGSTPTGCLLTTPDGKSLTGVYYFSQISPSCTGDKGTIQISFP